MRFIEGGDGGRSSLFYLYDPTQEYQEYEIGSKYLSLGLKSFTSLMPTESAAVCYPPKHFREALEYKPIPWVRTIRDHSCMARERHL